MNCIPFKQEGIYGSISLNASDSEKLSYQNISNNLNLNYKIENRTKPPGVYLTPYNNTNILVSIYASNDASFDTIYITAETSHSAAEIFLFDRGFVNEEKLFRTIINDICNKLNLSSNSNDIIIDDNDFDPGTVLNLSICCSTFIIFVFVIIYGIIYYRQI